MKNPLSSFPSLSAGSYLIDTHCHLDMEAYADDLNEVIFRAQKYGVKTIITIGIDLPSSKAAVKLAQKHKGVYATIGVHPHDVDHLDEHTYEALRLLYRNHKQQIVGYGEIGLDYVKMYSEPANQRKHFTRQLELAQNLGLPVVIHNREADTDTLFTLQAQKNFPNGGIMHCFSGDYDFAVKIIDMGLKISIPGVVTFKNATKLQEVVTKIPIEHMIVETDGPFLSPHPFRGKRNEPAHVLFTAMKIAELKNISIDEVAHHTSVNATTLFNLN
ncbi:TatD family hydrolase [Desulforhopalus sp. IMCC35007]|uniref:TatD family hydrolase n=1 Tax=Desulforhopalus sp. IMCC35007 TaxID=2569543 RepID=UPI001F1090C7|nr:TatD family hydrolase [Desulforhopalus sp. IMCC35007]